MVSLGVSWSGNVEIRFAPQRSAISAETSMEILRKHVYTAGCDRIFVSAPHLCVCGAYVRRRDYASITGANRQTHRILPCRAAPPPIGISKRRSGGVGGFCSFWPNGAGPPNSPYFNFRGFFVWGLRYGRTPPLSRRSDFSKFGRLWVFRRARVFWIGKEASKIRLSTLALLHAAIQVAANSLTLDSAWRAAGGIPGRICLCVANGEWVYNNQIGRKDYPLLWRALPICNLIAIRNFRNSAHPVYFAYGRCDGN